MTADEQAEQAENLKWFQRNFATSINSINCINWN